MKTLVGSPALSDFRRSRLLTSLQNINPSITGVYAVYIHIMDTDAVLNASEQNKLEQILSYGPRVETESVEGPLALVVPRVGTISPWSSKATDILHICGLNHIRRIERGIAYYLQGADWNASLLAEIHDRMTETTFCTFEESAALFVERSPSQ